MHRCCYSASLDHEEHERVIAAVVERAAGRIRVLPGTGSNSTREALRLTRFAHRCGADGALMVGPYYNKPTQEGYFRHFAAVAEGVDLPIVLYRKGPNGGAWSWSVWPGSSDTLVMRTSGTRPQPSARAAPVDATCNRAADSRDAM